jgi:hypothetical protein
MQAFADQGFAGRRRGWRELHITFCDDAETRCELDEREGVPVGSGGMRVRVESELGSLEVGPFEGLRSTC